MTQLSPKDITRLLPHRYPFLFVDRIADFVPGQRIVAVKHFSINDRVAQGNPPGVALIPTGVILELVTQVGAVLVMERPEMVGRIAMILQIPSAQIIKPVEAGDTVRVEAEVLKMKAQFGELRGSIFRDGELVAQGQMRFGIANAEDILPGRGNRGSP
ncbi:MAG TPA: 3-hydroxyacyl-[acyl-carrier-protein] dehydratase FabZ [Terriglobia bacterium]|nr:3-hydroxyacyl-[acyl-carrier-protein] dehydratase FabZ [Terriglobia bacterium]